MEPFELEIEQWEEVAKIKIEGVSTALKIPKYGSLTLSEMERLGAAQLKWEWLVVGLQRPEAALNHLSDGELEHIAKSLPIGMQDRGYQFMLGELNQWTTPEPLLVEQSQKKLTGEPSITDFSTTSPANPDLGLEDFSTAPST